MYRNTSKFNVAAADFIPEIATPVKSTSSSNLIPDIVPPLSALEVAMQKFDELYDMLTYPPDITEECFNSMKLLVVMISLIDEICLEVMDEPNKLYPELDAKIMEYYERYFQDTRDVPEQKFPLTTNIVLLPNVFEFLINKARERKEWLDVIFSRDNLYWLVMNCITHGLYRSWHIIRNLILDHAHDYTENLEVDLYINHFNSCSNDNIKIICEASLLGFKDHRLEFAITLLQRKWRHQPLQKASDSKKMIGLRNLHGLVLSHLDENSTILAYNKGLYPCILAKMLSRFGDHHSFSRESEWINAYKISCPEIADAYNIMRQRMLETLSECVTSYDILFKISILAFNIQQLCPDFGTYTYQDIFKKDTILSKLRFNFHTINITDEEFSKRRLSMLHDMLHNISYRTIIVILDCLPYFTVTWGEILIRRLLHVDLERINDDELRFWFFQLNALTQQELLQKYALFKVTPNDLNTFLSRPVKVPLLKMPTIPGYTHIAENNMPYFRPNIYENVINVAESSPVSSVETRPPPRRRNFKTLISRLFSSAVKRYKTRVLIETHLATIRETYKNGKTPEEYKLAYDPVTVHPLKI